MAVKQHQTKLGLHSQWLLAIILVLAGFGLILAPTWAALTPSPVVVDTQVKVKFSLFKLNKRSNTYDGEAKITNRSTQPIRTPIRLAIKNIKPTTVTLANATGLLADGTPYVNVPVLDGILSPREEVEHIRLKFSNPNRVKFTFSNSVLGVIPHANHPPIANAGADQSALVGSIVALDGSSSTDEDGDPLTYRWRIASQPAANAASIDDTSAIKPNVTIHQKGSYQIELIVNDGTVDSTADIMTITTENSKPLAVAGDDQTVFVNQTALLDGILSTDVDGDPLTYRWNLSAKPPTSLALLQNPDTQTPTLTPDKPGTYTVQLIVNDGLVDSVADQVLISTQNSKPIANAGPDQNIANIGLLVTLNGNQSSDVDGDALTYIWSLLHQPLGSQTVIQQTDQTQTTATFTPDKPGDYVGQLIVNDSHSNSDPDTALVTVTVPAPPTNNPPHITASPILTATVGSLYSYDVDATDADNDTLIYSLTVKPTGMTIDPQTGVINWTPGANQTGAQSVTVLVTDSKASDSQSYTVTVAPAGLISIPTVTGLSRSAAETAIQAAKLTVGTPVFINNPATAGNVISQVPSAGASVAAGSTVTLNISLGPDLGLPPDPATVAPPVENGVATTLANSTAFLYSGANPIQTGVASGTIDIKRAAVIRGRVLDKSNAPLSGVAITILNHPELGQTLSRTDGKFDMAVNGGGLLTISYQKIGYSTAQRQIQTVWQDFAVIDDVVLVQYDPQVTSVDLAAATPIQVARGSVSTDADGNRQGTLLFPQGTTATMTLADGTIQPLTSLHVRATEFTVGTNGPQAMPGTLPSASAYTYAVNLTVDEAEAAGAKTVEFSQPVPYYVENFLDFPIGTPAPAGYYDKAKGLWIAAPNGLVIKVLSITNGLAELDTEGTGTAASTAQLTALGITDAERQSLAQLYVSGQSLWRVPIKHFTPWDINWPYKMPDDAIQAEDLQPKDDIPLEGSCEEVGSIIECENQVLGETLPITGTPYTLNYRSNRVPGRKAAYTLQIPVSGATVPNSLKRIDLIIEVAGRRFEQHLPPTPNQTIKFDWDGFDAFGRRYHSPTTATIKIGYAYTPVYSDMTGRLFAFARFSGIPFNRNTARTEIIIWREQKAHLGVWANRSDKIGAWSLNVHNAYDWVERVLYYGDGSQRGILGATANTVITTYAGGPLPGFSGDGGRAEKAQLLSAQGIAVGPDGSLYIADTQNNRIRRVNPDGIIGTVAGNGTLAFSGDGGPATQASLIAPIDIALAQDGSLYIVGGDGRIRRVGTDGIINTVAGNGTRGFSGDGGPATQASLDSPSDIAVAPDGSFYISDGGGTSHIRRVGPDGIITSLGNGTPGLTGDGGPVDLASVTAGDLTVGVDGSLYIVNGNNVRRISPDGIIDRFAGNGQFNFTGDGGPATQASLRQIRGIDVGVDGSLYIADFQNGRIRRVAPNGIMTTVAGNGVISTSGDSGTATQASINPRDIAVGPDGSLYILGVSGERVRRVSPVLPGFSSGEVAIPSEDGAELYRFDTFGRHLATLNALTGSTLLSFNYNATGNLTNITDANGLITEIKRDALNNSTAIIAPFGQRTTLSLDGNGYLASVANPAAESHAIAYTPDGLLTSFTDPRGNTSTMTYNDLGRLFKDENAVLGGLSLSRTELIDGRTVSLTSALNRVTSHAVRKLTTGDRERKHTQPDNTVSTSLERTDGTFASSNAEGTLTTLLQGPDPRFSMLAPITQSLQVNTGGLSANLSSQRTAVMANPTDPFTLTTLTDTVTVNGRTSTTVYDGASKTFTATSPAARQSKTVIDSLGRVTQAQMTGILPVNNTYDPQGRPATMSQGTGVDERLLSFAYNPEGYLASVTDPMGRQVKYEYDLAGRVTRQILPDTREILFTYDANGNLESLLPPGKLAHSFTHTPINLTASYVPPTVNAGSNSTLYSYNLDKQLAQVQRPDGLTLDYTYDTAGRTSTITVPEGNYSYGYSPITGKLASITTPDGQGLNYTFNGVLPTLTSWTGTVSGNVGKAYDNNFRVSSISVNGTTPFTYQYDNDSLLTAVGNTTLGINLTLTRNDNNGLLTGTAMGSLTDSYTYNGFGEVTSYLAKFATADMFKTDFTRDKLGRITQKIETVSGVTHTFDYAYDLAGRLVEVKQDNLVQESYGYDDNGNRTQLNGVTIAHYDAQDRLLDYNNATFDYTANGELKSKTVGAATTSYHYDVLGNLRNVILSDGTTLDYVIDGQNRRIGKKRNGVLEQGFLYQDQLKPIAELDGNAAIVSRFVYANGVNVPDYMIKGGVTYRIIKDHLGSPRLVVDTATNTVIQSISYDAWGNVLSNSNPGFQPFGFAGGIYDRDTGLVRFGARDYDAITGRWTNKDTIGFAGGDINIYHYSLNNPMNLVDYDGKNPLILVGILVGITLGLGDDDSGSNLLFPVVGGAIGGAGSGLASLRLFVPNTARVGGSAVTCAAGSGRLQQVLNEIQQEFQKINPRSLFDGLQVIGTATNRLGLGSGIVTSQSAEKVIFANKGGVITTVLANGTITIQRGQDILLNLLP